MSANNKPTNDGNDLVSISHEAILDFFKKSGHDKTDICLKTIELLLNEIEEFVYTPVGEDGLLPNSPTKVIKKLMAYLNEKRTLLSAIKSDVQSVSLEQGIKTTKP